MKFKVWDDKEKCWCRVDNFNFMINQKGDLCIYNGRYVFKCIPVGSRYKPVFSSETHDEKGTELFDGDLAKDQYGDVHEIHYNKKLSFWFFGDVALFEERERIEKIGSKFENPELLEQ